MSPTSPNVTNDFHCRSPRLLENKPSRSEQSHDDIYAALEGAWEIVAPGRFNAYEEDGVDMYRCHMEAEATTFELLLMHDLRLDVRGDAYANAAETLRKFAADLEVASERIEAARDA